MTLVVARSESSDASSRKQDWRHEESSGGQAVASPVVPLRGLSSLRPFHHRNFFLLWAGGMVSVIGSWMQTVAVGVLIVARTGSATWAVVIAAGGFLPIGLLSPVGGALADRIPRRAALVAGNLLAGAVALAIAILVAAGRDSPGILTLLVTVQGSVSAMVGPFQQAILPDLVPPSEFLAAVSLNSAQFNLGRIVGPALAGVTIMAFGYPVAFVANAVSFLAVVVALFFIRLSPPPGRDHQVGLLASLRLGARAARAEPGCRNAIAMIAIVGLSASPFIALVPVMAHRLTHTGASGIASRDRLAHDRSGHRRRRGGPRRRPPRGSLREGQGAHRKPRCAPACAPRVRLRPVARRSPCPRCSSSGSFTWACCPACPPSYSSAHRSNFVGACSASTGRARRFVSDRFTRSGTARRLFRPGLDDCRRQRSPGDRARHDAPGTTRCFPGARGPDVDRGSTGYGPSLICAEGPASPWARHKRATTTRSQHLLGEGIGRGRLSQPSTASATSR